MSRPLVSVFASENKDNKPAGTVTLPAVFTAPIRHDLVHYVHSLMAKNARQPYAVTRRAGMMVSTTGLLFTHYRS
jgi:large subunit ribosomal protein L4e